MNNAQDRIIELIQDYAFDNKLDIPQTLTQECLENICEDICEYIIKWNEVKE